MVTATAAEVAASLPGDELVSPADVTMDRAFTLDAPPLVVWPWVLQLGKGRSGWYFPRALERFIPRRRRGIRYVDPKLQHLAVGDVVPDWGGADATFTAEAIVPGEHLLYSSVRGRTRLTWVIRLTALDAGRTRLHLRLRLAPVRRRRLARIGGGFLDWATVAGLAAGLRERVAAQRAQPPI